VPHVPPTPKLLGPHIALSDLSLAFSFPLHVLAVKKQREVSQILVVYSLMRSALYTSDIQPF
jgi:hypothetical protein